MTKRRTAFIRFHILAQALLPLLKAPSLHFPVDLGGEIGRYFQQAASKFQGAHNMAIKIRDHGCAAVACDGCYVPTFPSK